MTDPGFTERTTMGAGEVTITSPAQEADTTHQFVGIDHAPSDAELEQMGGALYDAIAVERMKNARAH